MANLYLNDTYLSRASLKVVQVCPQPDGSTAFALADNIGRPQGGGQPADTCSFFHGNTRFEVRRTYKETERPFRILYEYLLYTHAPVAIGDVIDFHIDHERRLNLSRCHTLTHVLMAAIRRRVDDYESRGAEILEDERTCRLWFASDAPLSEGSLKDIDLLARAAITDNLPVMAVTEPSIDTAKFKYDAWRVDPTLALKGKVRVIVIGDSWDANPCSGTHVRSTGEIGAFIIHSFGHNAQRQCWELRVRTSSTWDKWYTESHD